MSIANLPKELRPREKLLSHGASSLNDAELLAIFLRTGIKGKSAIDLSYEIIKHFKTLDNLFNSDLDKFSHIKGLGIAKYTQLKACIEMSKRVLASSIKQNNLDNINSVLEYLNMYFANLKHEKMLCLCLDIQYKLIDEIVYTGHDSEIYIDIADFVRKVLLSNAKYIILAHNHTNGIEKPSQSDILLTQKILNTLKILHIDMIDHIIITNNSYYSMKSNGWKG